MSFGVFYIYNKKLKRSKAMKKFVTLLLVMVFLTGGVFFALAKGDKADEPEEKAMEEMVEAEGPSDEVVVDE